MKSTFFAEEDEQETKNANCESWAEPKLNLETSHGRSLSASAMGMAMSFAEEPSFLKMLSLLQLTVRRMSVGMISLFRRGMFLKASGRDFNS